MENPSKKRIFFGLHHTIGDVISTTAILRAIKIKYPEYNITYATSKECAAVLEFNSDISEIAISNHPFDIVLMAGKALNEGFFKVFTPLQLTQTDSIWHQLSPWCVDAPNHNLVDFYNSRCMDDLTLERKTYVYPQQKHWDEVVNNIPEALRDYFTTKPYITIHTTTRNTSKDWKYESFVELTHRIKNKYNDKLEIYQIGGKDDKPLQNPVIPFMGIPILNSAAVIQKSKYHIDVDSGTSFIADSLNTPMTLIYGCSNKYQSGPLSSNFDYIEPSRKCTQNGRWTSCTNHCENVMAGCIDNSPTVDEVFNRIDEKLSIIFK